ncbi:MAG: hypothetical protein N3H31_05625 [Candidatus Nezhaarchaeota archaeon]|nr:hypothetical protein [Candidatus Nezhaarchaeota archaeon]
MGREEAFKRTPSSTLPAWALRPWRTEPRGQAAASLAKLSEIKSCGALVNGGYGEATAPLTKRYLLSPSPTADVSPLGAKRAMLRTNYRGLIRFDSTTLTCNSPRPPRWPDPPVD